HRLEHVVHELLDLIVEAGYFGCRFFQDRIAKFHNWVNHLEGCQFSETNSSSVVPDSLENFVSFPSSNRRRISQAHNAPVSAQPSPRRQLRRPVPRIHPSARTPPSPALALRNPPTAMGAAVWK